MGLEHVIVYFWIGLFVSLLLIGCLRAISRSEARKKIHSLADNGIQVTPEEIIKLREATLKRNKYRTKVADDYVGVYVIHNVTKDLYYVGQAKKVLQRVTQHFTGHGNGDVYADYKYGDNFSIKTIAFSTSGYNSIDKLEKDTIEAYDAFSKGYNKNRGNTY